MNSRERAGDTGLPGSSLPAARVSFDTFSQPSLRPSFLHSAFSTASASRGTRKLTALSAPTFATLITMALMAVPTSPRVVAWRTGMWNWTCDGPRDAAADRLDRRMKGQGSGWMADGEDGRLPGLEVVGEINGPGGSLAAASGRRGFEDRFLGDPGRGGQKLGRQAREISRRRLRGRRFQRLGTRRHA